MLSISGIWMILTVGFRICSTPFGVAGMVTPMAIGAREMKVRMVGDNTDRG